jgi:hypothetical protein
MSTNGTSQCVSSRPTVTALQNRPLGNPDGRHYNVQLRDGTVTPPGIRYAQHPVPALGTSVDFAGGYYRIHEVETLYTASTTAAGCQLRDATHVPPPNPLGELRVAMVALW